MKKAHRIDVMLKIPDTRAQNKAREFRHFAEGLKDVCIADSYTFDYEFSKADISKVLDALTNKEIEVSVHDGALTVPSFACAIEVGFLPGVTDNIGTTAKQTMEDATGKDLSSSTVSSSKVYMLYGKISKEEIERIRKSLFNPLIQYARIYTKKEFSRELSYVDLHAQAVADTVSLNISDEELSKMGKEGIKGRGPLALSLSDMKVIQNHFTSLGRDPKDIELEMIAQTWSEHCKHRIFASPMESVPEGIYKGYIRRATEEIRRKKGKKDFCVSVFSDNSGVIELDDNWLVSHKVETHNSPSALDPYGGAITGIVGVNRDAIGTGIGAKPVANIYGFCVGNPSDKRTLYRDKNLKEEMLSPRRILDGVVEGVNVGGNASGIPTVHGFLLCEDRFRGKPLVFAGTVGLLPKKVRGKDAWKKGAKPGEYIVTLGNRVGLDGIHGATFSSVKLDEGSPATAVQIGDPITQKKFSDALIKEARDMGLYTSITDNGAGGLSSAIGEMARESGGCRVTLEKVPVKYPGLAPWQIWISESQERMTLSVPKKNWKKLKELLEKRGVEATVIGEFTKTGKAEVLWNNKKILDIDLEFLHSGWPKNEIKVQKPSHKNEELSVLGDIEEGIIGLLSHPSIASNAYIMRQYDHEVQGGSVMKPLQGRGAVPAPSSVFKPVPQAKAGVLLTSALYPEYSDIDTYVMASASIDTAVRNALAGGAPFDRIALLDNFCWSRSNTPESMYALREAARACFDTAVAYGAPFISGKDSMHNDFHGFDAKGKPLSISVPPTLLASAIAVLPNALSCVSLDFKHEGDLIYLVGETNEEFGGSEYSHLVSKGEGIVPQSDVKKWASVYKKYSRASKYVSSALALSKGGLSVGLSKMSIAGGIGCSIDISKIPGNWKTAHGALFSESQGRILVTVSKKNKSLFEKTMGKDAVRIGTVEGECVSVSNKKEILASLSVEELSKAFNKTFKDF